MDRNKYFQSIHAEVVTYLSLQDPLGNTPLHLAIQNENDSMALHLLEHGADPNIFNINGQTALMNAAKRGNVTILEKLLSRGSNFTNI